MKRLVKKCLRRLGVEEKGAIFVEALIILPVMTIFAAGIMEFGNVLWQRHQMQTGVRDAARYMARCSQTTCSEDIARAIAFVGQPSYQGSTKRIPNWPDEANQSASDALEIFFLDSEIVSPDVPRVAVRGRLNYEPSPWYGALGINLITLEYVHVQRNIGR